MPPWFGSGDFLPDSRSEVRVQPPPTTPRGLLVSMPPLRGRLWSQYTPCPWDGQPLQGDFPSLSRLLMAE